MAELGRERSAIVAAWRDGYARRDDGFFAPSCMFRAHQNESVRHGSRGRGLRLSVLRRGHAEVGGPVRRLRRLEHPGRGGRRPPARRTGAARAARARAWSSKPWPARPPGAGADRHRPGGIRPGLRRRRRAGSAILLAGDPGVGKSTLLLQVCGEAAERGAACAYISGEEALEQIRARAQRHGPGAGAGEAGRRNVPARHHRRLEARAIRPGGDRFDPDPVERRP